MDLSQRGIDNDHYFCDLLSVQTGLTTADNDFPLKNGSSLKLLKNIT
jgi:hypothetical protein